MSKHDGPIIDYERSDPRAHEHLGPLARGVAGWVILLVLLIVLVMLILTS